MIHKALKTAASAWPLIIILAAGAVGLFGQQGNQVLPSNLQLANGVITGSTDPNLPNYLFLGSSIIDSYNFAVSPDDVASFIGKNMEVNIGLFVDGLPNRVAVLQTLLQGTNGGIEKIWTKPDGGNIAVVAQAEGNAQDWHLIGSGGEFIDPGADATVYDTTAKDVVSANQVDALSLIGSNSAVNLNFYERGATARKAAFQANTTGTNGGALALYSKIDGGGLTQVEAWNPTIQTVFTPLLAGGTQTVSGCSLTSALGGGWSGSFHSGTAGTCTVTITPGGTATNGWECDAWDITTTTDKVQQITPLSTTTCIISGTTASGDIITWKTTGF